MRSDSVELIRRAYEAYSQDDLKSMLGFADPNVKWTYLDPSLPQPEPLVCRGREEVEALLRQWAEHGLKAELEEVAGAGEGVMVGSRVPGLGASFSRPGEDQAYTVLRLRRGRIVSMRDCRGRRDALEVAGLEDSAG
jgi:ketosteroid isomerase-like protein